MEDEPERGSPLSADDALQEFMSAIDQFPEKMLAKQLAVRGDDMLVSFFDRHKHDMPESLEGSFSTSLRRLTRNTDILEDQGFVDPDGSQVQNIGRLYSAMVPIINRILKSSVRQRQARMPAQEVPRSGDSSFQQKQMARVSGEIYSRVQQSQLMMYSSERAQGQGNSKYELESVTDQIEVEKHLAWEFDEANKHQGGRPFDGEMQKHVRKIKELETRLQILVSQVNSTGFVGSLGRREPMGRPWEKQGLRSASLSKSRERSRSESMLRLRGGTKGSAVIDFTLRGTSSESEQSDDESKQAEATYAATSQSGRTMPESFLRVSNLVGLRKTTTMI